MKNKEIVMNKKNILIVDDIQENLQVLFDMLKKMGHDPRPARNGYLALMFVEKQLPDLILLDITMPDMDGYVVCQKLKENKATKDIPVIYLSAHSDVDAKLKAFQSGGVDYISKPFQIEEVKSRIETHLALSELQNSLRKKNTELETAYSELKNIQDVLIRQARFSASIELLSNIAHQWRQPLNFISLSVAKLLEDFRDGTMNPEEVEKNAQDALNTIQDLSYLITKFRDVFHRKINTRISIKTCITNVLDMLEEQLQEQKIVLNFNIIEDLEIDGLEDEYQYVILQIIRNSIEAMERNAIIDRYINITIDQIEEHISRVIIEDNGGGIDKSMLQKLFEPYSTIKFPGGKVGLSLYNAKLFIENDMRGSIQVENSERGAIFKILVPY